MSIIIDKTVIILCWQAILASLMLETVLYP